MSNDRIRVAIRMRGVVQGVGMRPSLARLATRLGISGFVRNDGGTVLVEVEGVRAAVERFVAELPTATPPLAVVESITTSEISPTGDRAFFIDPSEVARNGLARISPDVAP
jgi:hydrogenase maturation protein HypF